MYSAYLLTEESRKRLQKKYPPKYDNFIGHHVTHKFPSEELPPKANEIKVVGHTDSGDGIEALVVRVDGSVVRPDGKVYHITWSINSNSDHKPKDSNELLALGLYTLNLPTPIEAAAVCLE